MKHKFVHLKKIDAQIDNKAQRQIQIRFLFKIRQKLTDVKTYKILDEICIILQPTNISDGDK